MISEMMWTLELLKHPNIDSIYSLTKSFLLCTRVKVMVARSPPRVQLLIKSLHLGARENSPALVH